MSTRGGARSAVHVHTHIHTSSRSACDPDPELSSRRQCVVGRCGVQGGSGSGIGLTWWLAGWMAGDGGVCAD